MSRSVNNLNRNVNQLLSGYDPSQQPSYVIHQQPPVPGQPRPPGNTPQLVFVQPQPMYTPIETRLTNAINSTARSLGLGGPVYRQQPVYAVPVGQPLPPGTVPVSQLGQPLPANGIMVAGQLYTVPPPAPAVPPPMQPIGPADPSAAYKKAQGEDIVSAYERAHDRASASASAQYEQEHPQQVGSSRYMGEAPPAYVPPPPPGPVRMEEGAPVPVPKEGQGQGKK
ncbi:hypothetical protein HDU96_006666 [Phlyctochytrium bullatum]|nr:hypothetical protein HDU96_006666 [Phlyctochytrium bullatum]